MSLEDSLEVQVGSLSEDRLAQFVEEDEWYFSESDSEDDEANKSEDETIHKESDKQVKKPSKSALISLWLLQEQDQTPWKSLCKKYLSNDSDTSSPRHSTTSSEIEVFIDSLLSQLGNYQIEDDDEDDTNEPDNVGGAGRDIESASLLEMEGGSYPATPSSTLERKIEESSSVNKVVMIKR